MNNPSLVSINTFNNGSTGHIMRNISEGARGQGWKAYCAYGRYNEQAIDPRHDIVIGKKKDVYLHYLYAKLTNKLGLGPASRAVTKKLICRLDEIKPDLIHLHNLHGYYLNIEVLFDYLKQSGIPVVWTLHDCWAFTGYCGYFDAVGCDKWKSGCFKCPQLWKTGSKGLVDTSKKNWQRKRELFTSLPAELLKIVTPSKWLAGLVRQSFLQKYPAVVINNGINTSIFKPRQSNIREKYSILDNKVLLGVANPWSSRKGLHDFISLSQLLSEKYVIVLVGLSQKQISQLPDNALGFPRTESPERLAEFYSIADIYLNLSREETMGLTTVEALACGTPVLVYNKTALPEFVDNEQTGFILDGQDSLVSRINTLNKNPAIIDACVKWGRKYDLAQMNEHYFELFESLRK